MTKIYPTKKEAMRANISTKQRSDTMIFGKGAKVKFLPQTMMGERVYTITQVIAARDDTGNVNVSVKLKEWRDTWHSISLLTREED